MTSSAWRFPVPEPEPKPLTPRYCLPAAAVSSWQRSEHSCWRFWIFSSPISSMVSTTCGFVSIRICVQFVPPYEEHPLSSFQTDFFLSYYLEFRRSQNQSSVEVLQKYLQSVLTDCSGVKTSNFMGTNHFDYLHFLYIWQSWKCSLHSKMYQNMFLGSDYHLTMYTLIPPKQTNNNKKTLIPTSQLCQRPDMIY